MNRRIRRVSRWIDDLLRDRGPRGFRRADEHLLRVTAAQGAGATKWARVDHRHAPSGSAARVGDDASGGAGANHDEIELVWHRVGHWKTPEWLGGRTTG